MMEEGGGVCIRGRRDRKREGLVWVVLKGRVDGRRGKEDGGGLVGFGWNGEVREGLRVGVG